MRKRILLLLVCLGLFALSAAGSDDLAPHVVSVHVTQQRWDHHSPWQKFSPQTAHIFGTVISGGYILTEAYPLADHSMIQFTKMGENRKYTGTVVLKDYNSNLAIIRPEETSFFADLLPVKLALPGIPEGDCTTVVWENGGILKTYKTSYLKSYVKTYRYTGLSLCHRMTTDQSKAGRGEPVFNRQGELMGIISNSFPTDKSVEVLSIDSIRRFLTDLEDGNFQGIPFYWVETSALKGDNNLKGYLGIGESEEGLYVSKIAPFSSGREAFLPGDVLQAIDGTAIDDNGTYEDPFYGKLHYSALLFLRKQVGDPVTARIVRKGRKREVSFRLEPVEPGRFLIQPENSDEQPGYVIWGGMLFQELTRDYLTSYGREWREKADSRLLYLYDYFEAYPEAGRNRIVILNKVFPDAVNTGYQGLQNQVLEKVNGITAEDLSMLQDYLGTCKDTYLVFEFTGGVKVVLLREKAEEANTAILKNYGIFSVSSF